MLIIACIVFGLFCAFLVWAAGPWNIVKYGLGCASCYVLIFICAAICRTDNLDDISQGWVYAGLLVFFTYLHYFGFGYILSQIPRDAKYFIKQLLNSIVASSLGTYACEVFFGTGFYVSIALFFVFEYVYFCILGRNKEICDFFMGRKIERKGRLILE